MKKIISMMLALACVCLAFASCGETPAETTVGVTGEATNPVEKEVVLKGDYQGKQFRILSAGNDACNDFNYEEENPDYTYLENAQYERLLSMEQNFNIDIYSDVKSGYSSASSGKPGPGFNAINTQIASNTPNYDLCLIASYDVTQLATMGYLYDMNHVPSIQLDSTRWDSNAIDSLSIKDVVFFTTGEITVSDNECAYCIMFNKKLADDYGIENPYDLVKGGQWTIEKFAEIAKSVSEDLNNDGKFDGEDRYGLLVWDDSITGMVNAAGQRCCTVNDNGQIELTFYNETTLDALNKYVEIAYDDVHALQYQRLNNSGGGDTWWQNNQGLFFTSLVGEMPKYREMENDFGILPYPKLTVNQDTYYTTTSPFNSQFVCIPLVVSDIRMVGEITEALAYIGEKEITPALYDVTLEGQSARDAESTEMLDIIFDNIVYDIGYYYQVGPYNKQLIMNLRERNSNWASMYESLLPAAESWIENINEAYAKAVAIWVQ